MHFLAIDVGTTTLKGAVLDLNKREVSHISRTAMPGKLPNAEPLIHELDPQAVVNAVRQVIATLRAAQPNAQGLVMCSQMHGIILVDPEGSARTPMITWQDQRAHLPHPSGQGTYFEWAMRQLSDQDRRHLGHEVRPGIPNVTLPWFDVASTRGSLVVSLPDYVLSQLSGDEPRIERSLAAAFGLLDLRTCQWHQGVIDQLGLGHLHFPEVVSHRMAPYTIDGLPCYAPIGDHQAALLGSALQQHELSINIATGSQVSALIHRFDEEGTFHTRPYINDLFLVTFPDIPAGRSLKVLLDLVTELNPTKEDPWIEIQKAVERTKSSDLAIDLSFFQTRDQVSGSIRGIHEDNLSVGHLFRGAFESMAEAYYVQAQPLPGAANMERLVFSGGVAQKQPVLRDLISQRFGLPYRVCEHPEDTLLGLMALSTSLTRD